MLKSLLDSLRSSQRIVLTTHARPDGDAIGSQLGLGLYLDAVGKTVSMINTDPMPYSLEWLPGSDRIEVFDAGIRHREVLDAAELVVVLDTNAESRLGRLGRLIRDVSAPVALVDHHTDPEDWFNIVYRSEAVSSTGQLVYEIMAADRPDVIGRDIATALYVAIMTDTGSFRFSNVTPRVHEIIGDIIARGGLDVARSHAEVYDKKSLSGIRLLSRVLQTVTLSNEGQVAHMVVSRDALRDTGAPVEETDGFVNWGLAIEGVRASLIFTETERGTKVSFRSKGEDHVHRWAQSLGGGGHPNASGAFLRMPLDDAIRKVVGSAERHLDLSSTHETSELSDADQDYLSMLNAQTRERRS
jgi:phosphoesterase RecJ-like protein